MCSWPARSTGEAVLAQWGTSASPETPGGLPPAVPVTISNPPGVRVPHFAERGRVDSLLPPRSIIQLLSLPAAFRDCLFAMPMLIVCPRFVLCVFSSRGAGLSRATAWP